MRFMLRAARPSPSGLVSADPSTGFAAASVTRPFTVVHVISHCIRGANMSNLEFENELLKEVAHENCLVVLSKGLGIEKLLIQMIRLYSEPEFLLLVLGTPAELDYYVVRQMEDAGTACNRLPKTVTADVSIQQRSKYYAEGGTLFITSRILVVDLLLDRIPSERICGIILYDAHQLLESHQEAFILRLFRSKNQKGFIKGISQTASAFLKGYGSVDRTMRSLFATHLFLWPRSRDHVVQSLEKRAKPVVMELRFNLTPLMESIQFAVMDLINMCLKEMKETNSTYLSDADEINIENAITPSFGRFLRKQLEPIWNQINFRTKRLIGDISLLRRILFTLTDEDCVSFYNFVESVKQGIRINEKVSDWIFWEPADTLFTGAKSRIFSSNGIKDELELEMNPKWTAFCEIVSDIREETKTLNREVNILVVVREESVIVKLKSVLDKGADVALKELYVKTKAALESLTSPKESESPVAEDRQADKKKQKKNPLSDQSCLSLSAVMDEFNELQTSEMQDRDYNVIFHSSDEEYVHMEEKLKRHKPWFIIMYDADMESIRRFELYQAHCCSPDQCKIYFLMFDASAEEQRYLTTLRKEKEAFEMLQQEKANMVIPEERDGKSGDNPDLIRSSELSLVNNRKKRGVSRRSVINQKVIVDTREFRSELPSLIYKRGIDVEPVTIEIGDYILTPETCVERKSVSDLIGSLNSGRLYNQVSVMTRHYKRSILLIEFDDSERFNLKGKISFNFKRFSGAAADTIDSLRKLILLTITFPQLRLIWSPSPLFSAETFEYLKIDHEQPDAEAAMNISSELLPAEQYTDKFDLEAKEFLLCLPGVNLFNVHRLMRSFVNMKDLMKKSEQELAEVMESERNAKVLFESLHNNLCSACVNKNVELQQQMARKGKRRK
jgi:DNA excision repair protein ERCC-4